MHVLPGRATASSASMGCQAFHSPTDRPSHRTDSTANSTASSGRGYGLGSRLDEHGTAQ